MRILQLIDSLEAGGAERMALNYANALAAVIPFSGLVVTRKEGPLLNQIDKKVSYLYLNRKGTIDFKALFALRKFVITHQVEIIHAHSTSFFLAFLVKLSHPRLKLIWHDHYGNSEFLAKRPWLSLRIILIFFNGIITVNQKLKIWAEQKIHFKNVVYLPNFSFTETDISKQTILHGIQGKRIVCLANLRVQKNHFFLLEIAKKIKESHSEWTFHLVGKDFVDDYSDKIKGAVLDSDLKNMVYLYGSKNDIKNILEQSEIGILTSSSEGLPVALLEYGMYGKSVVATNVGEIPLIIQDGINGFLVGTHSTQLFYDQLVKLIENEPLRADYAKALQKTISDHYSEEVVIKQYLKWLNTY